MATEKMTKVEMFENIRDYLNGNEMSCSVDEAVEFIDKQIEQLEAKAAKAKYRAAAKRADGDALRETVFQCVDAKPKTIDEITADVINIAEDASDITKAKVTARLTQLVKNGSVVKEQTKVGTRKVMVYSLAVERVTIDASDDSLADTEPEVIEDNEATEE